ncbi:MAG: hypothetical protein Q9180_007579 [Flavoplaca navasiana]
MEMHQRIIRKEQAEAEDGWPFHSQVLYTQASQLRYARDPVFTLMYETVNRAPLKDGVKTVDPGEQPTPPVQTPEPQTPTPPPGNPNQRGRFPSATGRPSNPQPGTTSSINPTDDDPLSLNTNAANVRTKKPVKPRNLISYIDVPPPTPSLPYTARTTAPRGRRPKQAPTQTPPLRKQPPRQAKAAKLDKPKPAQGKSKAKPATQTTPRPRGRPSKKPATKRRPKPPPKAKAQPKSPPKPRSQPSKQLTKVSKRTSTPRNPKSKPPSPPPPTQIIETTHVRLRKPYPASIREPPFLPGRAAPVPQITIASAPTTDKGGKKRKSDDGITTRSGKRVRFNVGGEREGEEEEDGEEEVIDVSSASESESEDDDGNEDGIVEVEPPAQTTARTRAGMKGKGAAKTVQSKGKG